MKAALLRLVRIVLWMSMLLLATVAGCSVQAGGDDTTHEACELEPQTLPEAASLEPHSHDEGGEEIGTTSEALSISCKMSNATGYKSGNAFNIKVVTVDGKKVEWKTANAFYAMAKAAAKSGVQIRVVSGFRTMAEQQYLYNCYKCGCCNGGNLAATPGYSNHQSGHALDLNTSSPGVYNWLANHGGKYGFKRTVPSEAWHWEWWGDDDGQGPCNGKTLKAKLSKKSSNAKRFRGKKADYVVCSGDKFEMSFTFKNKGSATWRDVKGRGDTLGSDVFLVTASGKKDKLTGKVRLSVKRNANSKVRGDRKAKNCTSKNGCRKTMFIKGGLQAKAPSKPGIYTSKWRLRDYSKIHGKTSKGFGPKAQLKFRVMDCTTGNCGCTVFCTDGTKHKVAADTSSAQCKSVGTSMCEPAQYLRHEFKACSVPGTGGSTSTGGTAGSTSTGGSGGTSGATSSSTGGTTSSGTETGGGEPLAEDADSSFPPEGEEEDPNAISSGEGETATSGTEEEDDPGFEDDESFSGDEEDLEGDYELASGEQQGCSVAGARSPAGASGWGVLALLGLAGAWRVARRRVRR